MESFDQASLRRQAKVTFSGIRKLSKPRANAIPLPIRQLTDEESLLLILCVRCAQLAGLSSQDVCYDCWWLPANLAIRLGQKQPMANYPQGPRSRNHQISRGPTPRYSSGRTLEFDPNYVQVSGYTTEIISANGKLIAFKKRIGEVFRVAPNALQEVNRPGFPAHSS